MIGEFTVIQKIIKHGEMEMASLTQRGAFVAIGGILLLSLGLAALGLRTVTTMVPFFFSSNDDLANMLLGGGTPTNGTNTGANGSSSLYGPIQDVMNFFNIPLPIIDYMMFLGTVMIFAAVITFPFFSRSLNTSSIRVTREIDKEKVFSGEFVHVKITIQNLSRVNFDFIEIYDAIPSTFELVLGENYILTQLPAKKSVSFSYVLRASIRGVFRIGPTKVIVHDRLGFYTEEDIREFYTEILVYPSYEDIRRMEALSKKRQIGKQFGSHKTKEKGTGDDFHSLRRYYPGDEFKKIDWKAFARKNELMVREYEAEKNIRILVFLDHSGSMGGGIPNNTKLDFAIRSTMLVMYMAQERKDLFGLITYASRPTSFIAPTSNKNVFMKLLETLALLEPRGKSNPLAAVDYVMQRLPRSSFYVFITDLEMSDPQLFVEAIKRARAAKNFITIISPFGPLFEAKLEELTPIERALAEAIAEEYLTYRKRVEDAIKRLDVEIINVGPDDMLPTVIQQYLQAKNAGKGSV